MENLKGKRENSTEMAFSSYASYLSTLERNVFKCSFCKKEFRSAQALGGHMNVHRRERAKKKLFPSSSHESLHKSPNPNLISSSSSSAVSLLPSPSLPFPSVRAPFCKDNVEKKASVNSTMSSFQHGDHPVMKRREVGVNPNKRDLVDAEVRELPAVLGKRVECSRVRMKKDVVKLDLSMDSMGGAKDDLDLELRLGRS